MFSSDYAASMSTLPLPLRRLAGHRRGLVSYPAAAHAHQGLGGSPDGVYLPSSEALVCLDVQGVFLFPPSPHTSNTPLPQPPPHHLHTSSISPAHTITVHQQHTTTMRPPSDLYYTSTTLPSHPITVHQQHTNTTIIVTPPLHLQHTPLSHTSNTPPSNDTSII